jgi:F-type H+-transporting ATPase subunit gamma
MATLKDIRRRIGSVKNTQKITRAMKLVSAAKFARANTAVIAARPYGTAFDAMVKTLVAAAGDEIDSPLVDERPEKKALVVVLGTDRGFCGSLNSNLFKNVLAFVREKRAAGVTVDYLPWGKRSRLFSAKQSGSKLEGREKVLDRPNYQKAKELAEELSAQFTSGAYDRIYLAFVEFKSALTQTPTVLPLLPVGLKAQTDGAPATPPNIIVEPGIKEIMNGLLQRAVASRVFRCMLEGAASEHGARMTAMDSATNNASDVLRQLKIDYNRARQAAITKELIEIISGAQAV